MMKIGFKLNVIILKVLSIFYYISSWSGKCWFYYNRLRYEFKMQFEIPATYPVSPPEIQLPELEGKTAKMYRGGKICCDIHFNPLWSKNTPRFGIAHALCLGVYIILYIFSLLHG